MNRREFVKRLGAALAAAGAAVALPEAVIEALPVEVPAGWSADFTLADCEVVIGETRWPFRAMVRASLGDDGECVGYSLSPVPVSDEQTPVKHLRVTDVRSVELEPAPMPVLRASHLRSHDSFSECVQGLRDMGPITITGKWQALP